MISKTQLEKTLATLKRTVAAYKSMKTIDTTESVARTEKLIAQIEADLSKR
jgi:hypothetical protein